MQILTNRIVCLLLYTRIWDNNLRLYDKGPGEFIYPGARAGSRRPCLSHAGTEGFWGIRHRFSVWSQTAIFKSKPTPLVTTYQILAIFLYIYGKFIKNFLRSMIKSYSSGETFCLVSITGAKRLLCDRIFHKRLHVRRRSL